MDKYFKELISRIKKENPSKDRLSRIKLELCRKHNVKQPPTDIQIFLNAGKRDSTIIKRCLQTKPVRTLSGVSAVAVMTKPIACPHGACRMCSSMVKKGIPQSYTGKEPATRRALRNRFDPYLQVFNRLEQYAVSGHQFDKAELIIMGGTFPSFPKKYRRDFVKGCFQAMNDFSKLFVKRKEFDIEKFKKFFELPGDIGNEEREKRIHSKLLKLKKRKTTLEKEQEHNDKKSAVRCIGITIETRSDYGKLKHGKEMLKLGCTRVELGIQSVYDCALQSINRGHTADDNTEAIHLLRDLGFKLNFHYMPGLPGISAKKDIKGMIQLFEDERYRPDMLKIYPCMVVKNSKLYSDWKKGKFTPLSTRQAVLMIAEFKKHVPEYCRIMRVQRDIPTYATEAGVDMTNLRQLIQNEMKNSGYECRCIRCREIGRKNPSGKFEINTIHYKASGGNEFFISADIGDSIAGFCRLRFPSMQLMPEITEDCAIIRELHVYGEATSIGSKGKVQHRGIGKALLEKAEDICRTYYRKKILVISGVGARGYYRKLGYRLDGPYMSKKI